MPAAVAAVVGVLIDREPDEARDRFEIERVTSDPAVQAEALGALALWRGQR
jgi:hypothetical protein